MERSTVFSATKTKIEEELKSPNFILSKAVINKFAREIYNRLAGLDNNSIKDITNSLYREFEYELDEHTISLETKEQGLTISDPKNHQKWSLTNTEWYYWDLHKKFISDSYKRKDAKNWVKIIKSIDNETTNLLKLLENPLRKEFNTKGLVIGYVQSGKTANFTALISKAMDVGYKLVVVLAGMHNSLRSQTQQRLDNELLGYIDNQNSDKRNIMDFYHNQNHRPQRVTTSKYFFDDKVIEGEFKANMEALHDKVDLKSKKNVVIGVIKKNVNVLKKFNLWLNRSKDYNLSNIPILVIDDEADQASVDGNFYSNQKKGIDIQNVTETNKQINILLNKFNRNAYIGYTATPFANCFIPADIIEYENLYPHSFIHFLPKPPSYFGAKEIFGNEEIKKSFVVSNQIGLKNNVRKEIQQGRLPECLSRAIFNFLISFGIRVLRKEVAKPMSMLVHIDHTIITQKHTHKVIKDEILEIKNILKYDSSATKKIISDLKKEYLYNKNVASKLKEKNDFFSFEETLIAIKKHLNLIEVIQVHSESEDEIDYTEKPNLKIIAVGGNKLSRGLTLEGLMTTYFLRDSKMADTLMQMGRFFGYRDKYIDLMKIFCPRHLVESFEYLIDLETDLRDEVSRYKYELNENGELMTPKDFAPCVRAHKKMKPSGKMGNSKRFRKTFGGGIRQTKYFKLNDFKELEENYKTTEKFFEKIMSKGNSLKASFNKAGKVFYDVNVMIVIEFLKNFKVYKEDVDVDSIINYLIELKLNNINIGIADLKSDKKRREKFGEIGDFALVQRSRMRIEKEGYYNIGALSSPGDLTMDLQKNKKRENPLIIIYRIDKNSKKMKVDAGSREDLFYNIQKKSQNQF